MKYGLVINWKKIPVANKLLKLMRDSVYDTLTVIIFKEDLKEFRQLSKEKRDDPHQAYQIMTGTEAECNKVKERIDELKPTFFVKIIERLKGHKYRRIIPSKFRTQYTRALYSKETNKFDKVVSALFSVGIHLYIEVIPDDLKVVKEVK